MTAWEFLRDHFDAVGRRAPRLGWLLAPAAHLCDERAAREVTRFFGEPPHRPSTPRAGLQQAEESITECAALRRARRRRWPRGCGAGDGSRRWRSATPHFSQW